MSKGTEGDRQDNKKKKTVSQFFFSTLAPVGSTRTQQASLIKSNQGAFSSQVVVLVNYMDLKEASTFLLMLYIAYIYIPLFSLSGVNFWFY